jgi:fructan beta-fructosidase
MMVRLCCAIAAVASSCAGLARAQDLYREQYRPQFHFTPEKNWMNDPNGLVHFYKKFHLFYQYNPEGDKWGHMSWGHAVSEDLVHWEHQPLALKEEDGIMIFSGSAVLDLFKSTQLVHDGSPPVVAIYTGHREGRQDQRLAYSLDDGRTWTKLRENPVLDLKMADFRDPKVTKHDGTWLMTVALPAEQKVHFYRSPNLMKWNYVGEFGGAGATDGLWECPDLIELTATTMTRGKWALIVNINPGGPVGGSGCQYFVGSFDGKRFVADPPVASSADFVPNGKILADFENGYGDWATTGNAFGKEPAAGTMPKQGPVAGFQGKRLANSFGDYGNGSLTSSPFEISGSHINFLIGGAAEETTRMDLKIDGKVVRTASGVNRECLSWQSWNVGEFRGQQAEIRISDESEGTLSHILIDQIVMSDEAARPAKAAPLWLDYGPDFYAAITWEGLSGGIPNHRPLMIAWMSNWLYANDVPTSPWRGAMTIPRQLRLEETPEGWRLRQKPAFELQKLPGSQLAVFSGGKVTDANEWLQKSGLRTGPLRLSMEFGPANVGTEGVKLYQGQDEETVVGIDRQDGTVFIDRTRSGNVAFHPKFAGKYSARLSKPHDKIKLDVYVDASSVEVFANDDECALTALVFPSKGSDGISFFGTESSDIGKVEAHEIYSIWAEYLRKR